MAYVSDNSLLTKTRFPSSTVHSSPFTVHSTARWLWPLFVALAFAAHADETLPSPSEIYGQLFVDVQTQRVFPDSKTFVDLIPKRAPAEILDQYRRERSTSGFNLRVFVLANFSAAERPGAEYHTNRGDSVTAHIDSLWPVLTRGPDREIAGSSLLPLPKQYVVPGGRFLEMYYWDSYFTMLGLRASGRDDLVTDMTDDFAYLIDRFGHVPNGSRTYYLSRSQPPFFAAMVELVAEREGDAAYRRYLPQLAKEYAFWMEGADTLGKHAAHRRVVRLRDGTLLNRYWDDRATPREESYREDVETMRKSSRPPEEMYRNLRAAAESGWDFSSRWLADNRTLATIHTVDITPIDLNSLLYHLESVLAKSYRLANDTRRADEMQQRADARRAALRRLFWSEAQGVFADFDWTREERAQTYTAACFYPLFFDVADDAQASATAKNSQKILLASHGLLTTSVNTGQQWDAPNGWAPLQWIAIAGLRSHGQKALAEKIAQRWIEKTATVYRTTGKLLEKYDVVGDAAAGGGEYPLQDGFGWTNGVLRQLFTVYPQAAPH
jgi:alpha,alpha-trehalase